VGHGWWFEDAVPGGVIEHPGGRTIGADEHILLAWLTNNASDVHGNHDVSARGAFGGPVVLGALTVAVVVGLAEPATAPPPIAARAIPTGWRRIGLVGLVLPGDTLNAVSHIEAARRDPGDGGGVVERVIVGRTQRGDEVVRIEEERWVAGRDEGQ
jgi:acyl dehydratase